MEPNCAYCGEGTEDECLFCGTPVCSYCQDEHEYDCEEAEESEEDDEGY